jgi:hypothetical protein
MPLKFFIAFVFLCVHFLTNAQNKKNTSKLEKDLMEFTALFEGEFDNFQQVYKEREDKVKEVHEHIHSIFKKIDFVELGKNVFYVLQYMDGDSTKIYRQRIYNFIEDVKENALRLDIYTFKVDSLFYYSNWHAEKITAITIQDIKPVEGCAVYWKKIGENFVGYMPPKQCHFVSKRSGKTIYATDSLLLNKNEIWIRDEAFDSTGARVYGRADKVHHKLKRCTFYTGWIILQKAGFENEYHSMRNLQWHDQGKRQRLYTEDGKATKYEVELANVVYGKDTEVLKLAIYEVGVSKAVMYTWTSPLADRVGINLRWIQTGLTKMK